MLRTTLALALLLPCTGFAQGSADALAPANVESAAPVLAWDAEARKSYAIPALEIVGFDFLLNQFNRHYFRGNDYDTDLKTIRRNLRSSWVTENDPFQINQLGHPYQ